MKRARLVLWSLSLGVLILIGGTLAPAPLGVGLVAASFLVCAASALVVDLPSWAGALGGALGALYVAIIGSFAEPGAFAVFAPWIAACALAGWVSLLLVRLVRRRREPR